jgi:hypothetical protein
MSNQDANQTGDIASSAVRSKSSKRRKTHKESFSDSSSGAANNENGRWALDERLRSVLSHPLCLALVYILHGNNPADLSYLARKSKFYERDPNPQQFDDIFSKAFEEWDKKFERDFTKALSSKIEKESTETCFHSYAEVPVIPPDDPYRRPLKQPKIDIVLSTNDEKSTTESTPVVVIEVGRFDYKWWSKLDQTVRYIDGLGPNQQSLGLRFTEPLLCAVLTIGKEASEGLHFKLGVFLCSPKESSGTRIDYRMTLLWHVQTKDLGEASKAFGRLLRAASDFSLWRASDDNNGNEYFSSNCCRVGDHVSAKTIDWHSPCRLDG